MRLIIGAALVAALMALGTSAAFAGEITGNGNLKGSNGNSPCSYSGQEDEQWYTDNSDTMRRTDPTKGDPAHSQSWGQIVSANGGHLGGASGQQAPIQTPDGPWGCNGNLYGLKK